MADENVYPQNELDLSPKGESSRSFSKSSRERFPLDVSYGLASNASVHSRESGASGWTNSQSSGNLDRVACLLPSDLSFLAEPHCNPDLRKAVAQNQGNIRSTWVYKKRPRDAIRKRSSTFSFPSMRFSTGVRAQAAASLEAAQNVANMSAFADREELRDGKIFKVRRCIGRVMLSWPVQSFVLAVILFDCAVTLISIGDDRHDDSFTMLLVVTDVLIITVFSVDILSRICFLGFRQYIGKKMNCFEVLLLMITIVDIVLMRNQNVIPTSVLRVLRPIMRLVRILRLFVRIFERGRSYQVVLRHHVSGKRKRLIEDGFDLDLAYITHDIIAMSLPGSGYAGIFHNPLDEVACFLNERHPNKYLVVNTTEERRYSTAPFFHRCVQFPIPQNGIPSLDGLMELCRLLTAFLEADSQHVIAIHSKHGQGRVGIVVAALLIERGDFETVPAAIAFLEQRRTDPKGHDSPDSTTQSIDAPSQERLLEYFAARCRVSEGTPDPPPRKVMLRKIKLYGVPDVENLDVSCFSHPGTKTVAMNTEEADTTSVESAERKENMESAREERELLQQLLMPHRVIQSKVNEFLKECEFDSRQAGSSPMKTRPLFSSCSMDSEHGKHKMKFRPNDDVNPNWRRPDGKQNDHTMTPRGSPVAIWEFVDTELTGEMRFEVHRSKDFGITNQVARGAQTLAKKSGAARMHQFLNSITPSWLFPFRKSQQRQEVEGKPTASGMLFSCWLHSSFLEMAEPPINSLAYTASDDSLVHVVLHRFELDKAIHAPALRNYTNSLKLHLEFQAERSESVYHRPGSIGDTLSQHFAWDSSIASASDVSPTSNLEWLNWLVKHLWPYAKPGLSRLLRESIEPAMQENVPPPLNNLALTEFAFGDAIPELGPISGCARHQEGFEVQLDVWVRYNGNVHVKLNAGSFGLIGINHLKLNGLLSVKLKPIIPDMPIIEGVQFLFLNMPQMDLAFHGTLGAAANMSAIKTAIMEAIQTALLDIIVMPNMVVLNWSTPALEAGDLLCTFQDVLPHAVLRLGVIQARDMTIVSSVFCGRRVPDPFAKLHMGDQAVTTAVATGSSSPFWGEEFDMLLYDEGQHITISVKDGGFNNHLLGQFREGVPVSHIIAAGQEGLWVSLVGQHGEPQGRICLTASVLDLREEIDVVKTMMIAQGKEVSHQPRWSGRARWRNSMRNSMRSGESPMTLTPSQDSTTPKHDEDGLIFPNIDTRGSYAIGGTTDDNGSSDEVSTHSVSRHPMLPDMVHTASSAINVLADQVKEATTDALDWCMDGISATAHTLATVASTATRRRGGTSVAVLICRVNGGHMQAVQEHLVDIRIRMGEASVTRRCIAAVHSDLKNVSDDLNVVIERLAMKGWDKKRIADVVKRDEALIEKVMKKQLNWNLDMPHRLCLPLTSDDCVSHPVLQQSSSGSGSASAESHPAVEVAVLHRNKIVGTCSVELRHVLDPPDGKVYRAEHTLATPKDNERAAVLDLEMRVYSLRQRQPRADGQLVQALRGRHSCRQALSPALKPADKTQSRSPRSDEDKRSRVVSIDVGVEEDDKLPGKSKNNQGASPAIREDRGEAHDGLTDMRNIERVLPAIPEDGGEACEAELSEPRAQNPSARRSSKLIAI